MSQNERRVWIDMVALNKRASGCDWYFGLDMSYKLMVVFRRRGNVMEMVDAAEFRLMQPDSKDGA